jgi:hypothetical protein
MAVTSFEQLPLSLRRSHGEATEPEQSPCHWMQIAIKQLAGARLGFSRRKNLSAQGDGQIGDAR